MGWVMLFVGLALPILIGSVVIGKTKADLPLTLIGLVSVPLLVWGASLGLKIGPCDVPQCMSSTQHSHYVIAIVGLVVLAGAFFLLARGQQMIGGLVLALAQLLGAYSMLKTDTASAITFLILCVSALGYLYVQYRLAHEADRVPDFPPAA
ncbi:MAG TPA: hypothetical protein VH817_19010 [Thermoleophilaceae bacterium]